MCRAGFVLSMALAAVGPPASAAQTSPASPQAVPDQATRPAGAGAGASSPGESTQQKDAAQAGAQDEETNRDMVLIAAQPEFTLVNLPTTLRMPLHRFAFRVTHRFYRDLTQGDFGDFLSDFFGFDGGAQIGLELRFGLMTGWQIGVYRTSDKTIELFTQYSLLRQGAGTPIALEALATFEGTNNLMSDDPTQPTGQGNRSPALGAVVSRTFGKHASVNATLAWVNNTNPLPSEMADHNNTWLLGIGGRVRIRPSVYVVAEISPRLGGYEPGDTLGSFGIEKRVGGHSFQLNFSNGTTSTLAQVARGTLASGDWHIGFNICRKFF